MSDPVHQLYQGLLADPSLDAALQRRILSYARRAAWPLLIALCAHPNLDPGIDRELKAVRVASVRAAWLTRPGRPVPAVVAALGDDRRIVVCTAAASVTALPGAVYARLASMGNLRVAASLLANPSVPIRFQRAAATTWGAQVVGSRVVLRDRLHELFTHRPHLLDALASRSYNISVLRFCVEHPLKPQTLNWVAGRLAVHVAALATARDPAPAYQAWVFDTVVHLVEQPGVATAMRRTLATTLAVSAPGSTAVPASPLAVRAHAVATAVSGAFGGENPELGPPALRRASSSAEEAELILLVATALRTTDRHLAVALALNPALPRAALRAVLPLVHDQYAFGLVLHHAGDPDAAGAILARHPHLVTDALLGRCGDPQATVAALVSDAAAIGAPLSPSLANSAYLAPGIVTALPASYVAHTHLGVDATRALGAALQDALGAAVDRWQIFETLASSFDGTVADLLATCADLAALPDATPLPFHPSPV